MYFWLDIPVNVGDGRRSEHDFLLAVHLTIYWAQNLSSGPICNTTHPPRRLAEKLRRGMPLPEDEMVNLGEGRWPPAEDALGLGRLPKDVPLTALSDGQVQWTLSGGQLQLRRDTTMGASTYVNHVEIRSGPAVRLRHTIATLGPRSFVPGVPRSLKLLSATCGLYDGEIRILPRALRVHTAEDTEAFAGMVFSASRQQPVVAVAAIDEEDEATCLAEVADYAREAFALQHVVAITSQGGRHVHKRFGQHGILPGAIKTYNAGFHMLDIQSAHPMTTHDAVIGHKNGRAGMLQRWRNRLMTRDAAVRQAVTVPGS